MKERPILFSGPTVRAILDGRKTQTRRVVTNVPDGMKPGDCAWSGEGWAWWHSNGGCTYRPIRSPYGVPGDLLWVRETWQYADWDEDGIPWIGYAADGATAFCENVPEEWCDRLTDEWAHLSRRENYDIDNRAADRVWRPSIHMPKWAARLWLRVTDVRVERLQDITEEDARAEGCAANPNVTWQTFEEAERGEPMRPHTARDAFAALWESLNARRGYGWDANPWVWVITFTQTDAP